METLKAVWDFFQTEILGMSWLNRLISTLLNACGLDTASRIGGSVRFFIYDTVKIMVLLGFLILIISYIQSFFPPERTKKDNRQISRHRGKYNCRITRHSNAILFVFLYSVVYRFYNRRIAARRNIFLFDFFSNG